MSREVKEKRDFFDRVAGGWKSPLEGSDKAELVEKILRALAIPRSGRVLDLCTGAGAALPFLSRHLGPDGVIAALDVSAAMLEKIPHAVRRVHRTGPVQGDGYLLPFASSAFDTIYCMAGLAHLRHKEKAVREMARVLAPGGRVAVVFLSCRHYLDALHRKIGGPVAQDTIPSLAEMERLLRDAGLLPEYLINERERLYLAVGRKAGPLDLADRVAALATGQIARYPALKAPDLYKALYQATMGTGHALDDPDGARRALARELESVEADPKAPIAEDVSLERLTLRVHLAPYKARGLPLDDLFAAFVDAASLFVPTPERMAHAWRCLEEAVEAGRIEGISTDLAHGLAETGAKAREAGFPALHHSSAFRHAYGPAYRLVCPATESLPPFLTGEVGR